MEQTNNDAASSGPRLARRVGIVALGLVIGLGLYGLDTVGNAVHTDLVCPMLVPGYHESVCHPVNRAITDELNKLLKNDPTFRPVGRAVMPRRG